jgi:Concanavalin A-like lectin/glucanases superfamily
MKTRKILKTAVIRAQFLIAIGIMVLSMASVTRAGLVGPYTEDGSTLHLWHLDETNGTPVNAPTNGFCLDSITDNPQTSPLVMSNVPGPVSEPGFSGYPPTSFLLMGQPAFQVAGYVDYGNALHNLGISSCLYMPWTNAPNNASAQPMSLAETNLSNYVNTNTGAFTFEALLKPDFDPINPPTTMEIICGDSGFSPRAWQFRFNAGKLEFNDITGSNPHQVFATLPASGPDAAAAGNWYHVAVTFTGNSPTNGDTARVFTFYWTLMDPTRTHADVLFTTNLAGNIHGSVFLTIGGNARGSPVNNSADLEGFLGSIDEVRISDVCRKSTEMAFNANQFLSAPIIAVATTNYFVGYGQTLTVPATVFGTAPVTNQWYQDGVALPGQTNTALVISNVTFAANGNYQLRSTNAFGSTNSVITTVTVGAPFQQLFNTGVDDNGNPVYDTAGGSYDLHWFLTSSPDPNAVVPYSVVLSVPLPTGPGYPIEGPLSSWIGSEDRPPADPGTYIYQTDFQIDEGDVASSVLSCKVLAYGPTAGATMQTFLNGVERDITLSAKPISLPTTFVLTNGLQAGTNTLVLSIPFTSGNPTFRAELSGIGNALSPGLPVITNPPAGETVQYADTASFSVVGVGRPPLSYQWLSNSIPIPGAVSPSLTFIATNFSPSEVVGGQFTANYQAVVGNDSGSVTSSVATLTVQIPPLTVTSAGKPIWNPTNNEKSIVVTFSGAVDPATATTVTNYSLDNGASVLSATLVAPNEVVLTTSVLNPATSYTLTIQNVKSSFGITMSPSSAATAVGIYPAVALWLKADAGVISDVGTNTVNEWDDQSGNGNNLFQPNGSPYEPQLVTNAINGEPVIRFIGTNTTYMYANSTPTLAITNDMSIFAVVNFATLAGGTNGMIVSKTTVNQPASYDYYATASVVQFYRGNGTTSKNVASTNVPSTGVPHLLDVVMQGTNVTERLDGRVNGNGLLNTAVSDNGDPLYLGTRADAHNRLTGDLAELIIINSALSTNDVASLENYLETKYGTIPTIHAALVGSNLTVTYNGTLLSSTNVAGPYTPVSGASSPYTMPPTNAQMFYRASSP